MHPRLRLTVILSVALAFCAAGPLWFGAIRKPSSATLPDGSTLTLVSTSFGRRHPCGGTPFTALAKSLPPRFVPAWMRETPLVMQTADPSLGLWFRRSAERPYPQIQWELVDSHGVASEVEVRTTDNDPKKPGNSLIGFAWTSFPRRDKHFLLRLTDPESSRGPSPPLIAEFRIANPMHGNAAFPEWTPPPLPQLQTTGDLEIEMVRLFAGSSSSRNKIEPAAPGEAPHGVAQFRVRQAGMPTGDWFPDGVDLEDATGNRMHQTSWGHQTTGELTTIFWSPALWSDPGGWKARFEFTREPAAAFSEAELIRLESLVLPTDGAATELDQDVVRLGHTITVKGWAPKGAKLHGQQYSTQEATLVVEASPPLLDMQLDLVGAVDDQGRQWKTRGSSWSRPSGTYQFRFEPLEGAKAVTFTLAVHASVYVEFHALPEFLVPPP